MDRMAVLTKVLNIDNLLNQWEPNIEPCMHDPKFVTLFIGIKLPTSNSVRSRVMAECAASEWIDVPIGYSQLCRLLAVFSSPIGHYVQSTGIPVDRAEYIVKVFYNSQ